MSLVKDVIGYGTHADRPVAGHEGRLYFESDTSIVFRDNGTSWVDVEPTIPVKIAEVTVGVGGAPYIEFTGIPDVRPTLFLDMLAKTDSIIDYGTAFLRINGDSTGAHYSEVHFYNDSGGGNGTGRNVGTTGGIQIGGITTVGSLVPDMWGSLRGTFPHYASTTKHKQCYFNNQASLQSVSLQATDLHAWYLSTSPITALRFTVDGGNFIEGSTAVLYAGL